MSLEPGDTRDDPGFGFTIRQLLNEEGTKLQRLTNDRKHLKGIWRDAIGFFEDPDFASRKISPVFITNFFQQIMLTERIWTPMRRFRRAEWVSRHRLWLARLLHARQRCSLGSEDRLPRHWLPALTTAMTATRIVASFANAALALWGRRAAHRSSGNAGSEGEFRPGDTRNMGMSNKTDACNRRGIVADPSSLVFYING